MSRLASLSTPQRSRASPSPSPSPAPAPASPSRQTETTHHRMLKLVLAEVRNVLSTWDEILLVDGMRVGKGCIDEATEMDNILTFPEGSERPPIAGHYEGLLAARAGMQGVLVKLDKLLHKLSGLIEQAEKLFFDACKTQTWDFVLSEPLWLSWTLENFVDSLPPLLTSHAAHHAELTALASTLMSSGTTFETAQAALERWRDLARGGDRWADAREWEEITLLEIAGPNPEPVEEEEVRPKRRGKRT